MTENFERGFISQNILAQLRNFVEHISFKEYCNGRDLDITFENLQQGNKYSKIDLSSSSIKVGEKVEFSLQGDVIIPKELKEFLQNKFDKGGKIL